MDVEKMSDIELAAWAAKLKTEIKAIKRGMRSVRRDLKQYGVYSDALSLRVGSLSAVSMEISVRREEGRKDRAAERRKAWRNFWDAVVS